MSPGRRPQRSGLFNGHWLNMAGRELRRIRRDEYPELYRLHRIGVELGLQRPLSTAERLGLILGRRGPWHAPR